MAFLCCQGPDQALEYRQLLMIHLLGNPSHTMSIHRLLQVQLHDRNILIMRFHYWMGVLCFCILVATVLRNSRGMSFLLSAF